MGDEVGVKPQDLQMFCPKLNKWVGLIFTYLKLWVAVATLYFKLVKI